VSDYLSCMIAQRNKRIAEEFGSLSLADHERLAFAARPRRDFEAAIRYRDDVAVIAEVKKHSPSAGPIAPECEASKQALHYQDGGAAAISVLTEPEDFGGSFADLSDVTDAVDIPVLCKDFVVSPVQIPVARAHGADAILLMVSVLGQKLGEYIDITLTFGMTPVVEVVDEHELAAALHACARTVCVNSRDLRTLQVDRVGSLEIVGAAARAGLTVISASGVGSRSDVVRAASAGAHGVLVGEVLMRADFPEELLHDELTGVAKDALIG